MVLDEIRSTVADTHAEHWHVLSGDAPTYFYSLGEPLHDDCNPVRELHMSRAVLRTDIDVGIVWGMSAGENPTEELWAARLGPKQVYAHVVEVLYRGQPVDREIYASVDNGHGIVPWPRARYAAEASVENRTSEPAAWEVNRWQYELTMVLHQALRVAAGGTVANYMKRCGISVLD